ncbi:MAG TPA: HEAT repeat domain-containing protein [Ktedonobacteraceae bacterium]
MMTPSDPLSQTNMTAASEAVPPEQPVADVAPPIGITPPQILAQDAAAGKRGAAWRLLVWIMENDPRAIIAVSSLDDDRLAQNLLEFIALGTWAGKPFVVPVLLRSALARTRLRTLFLPGAGIDSVRAQRIAMSAARDKRPAVRETAIYILGLLESPVATPMLIQALDDQVPSVRLQAVKALGRVGNPEAVPALLNALRGADEQLGSQIFSALVRLGRAAVPALLEASNSNSTWMRWQAIRALGAIRDRRALPVLVGTLSDTDHSVAWMGAKGLTQFGRLSLEPVLQLLVKAEMTPWLVETASYVLSNQIRYNPKLKPYLEPVMERMHALAFRVGTSHAAQQALAQLQADGMIESS